MTSDLPPAGGPNPASSSGTSRGAGATASTPPSSSPSGPRGVNDFFAVIRRQGVYRANDGRWAAGVASGLARRWDLDPILIRGIFVALTFAGGLGIGAYGIGWLLIPQQDGRIHLQQALHGRFSAGFFGGLILALALLGDPSPWGGSNWLGGPPRFVAFVLLIVLVWWIVHHHDDGPRTGWGPPWAQQPGATTGTGSEPGAATGTEGGTVPEYGTPGSRPSTSGTEPGAPRDQVPGPQDWRRDWHDSWQQNWNSEWDQNWKRNWAPGSPDRSWPSHRITRFTLGLALLAAGAVLLAAHQADAFGAPAGLVAAAAALGVIGAGVIIAGLAGRRSGGLAAIGVLLAAAVLISAGVHHAGVRAGQNTELAGDFTWHPVTVAAAQQQYNLGAGQAELNLTDPRILTGATPAEPLAVDVKVGVGQLTVLMPAGVAGTVTVELGAGQVTEPSGTVRQADGNRHRFSIVQSAAGQTQPVLVVNISQGAGEIRVRSAPAAPSSSSVPSITATKEPSHA